MGGNAGAEPDIALAERLFAELAARTRSARGVTRPSYGLGEQIAHDLVRHEALRLGLEVATDAACNLYLTLRGAGGAPGVYIGSHLDTVPMGGNFDGTAGVLMGLAVVAGYRRAGIVPPRDVTVMAIRAEESTWFPASYIGSRGAFGLLTAQELDKVRRVDDGVALGASIDAAGGDSAALRSGAAGLDPARIGCFIEPHIEQGPVLIARGLPIGIVTGIRGSFRYRLARCLGAYAHSGATPREGRQDAVRATARLVVAMDDLWEGYATEGQDLTVTFGQMATDPTEAAFSKVAGRVTFALDVRSASDAVLDRVHADLLRLVAGIEAREGVRFDLGQRTGSAPAQMAPAVIEGLGAAARDLGIATMQLPCGAGHDAATFAAMGVPSGMVFLRNANGSHNPEEHMDLADFASGARVVARFCLDPPLA